MASRRRLLRRLAATAGLGSLAGCTALGGQAELDLPSNLHAVPDRQHAWNATLRTDGAGNHLAPRHHRVLLLELDADPTRAAARTTERAMRALESFDWGPGGLLHLLAWGSGHFASVGELGAAPVDHPRVLSRTDEPRLLRPDAALVLASDVPSNLVAAERAMFGDRATLAGEPVEARLGDVFSVTARRTGFIGSGLPAKHTQAEGIPSDAPLGDRPMFTGFFSGRDGTQAGEDRVTIQRGAYAGGTTMHLSHLTLSLETWWEMTEDERVDRMFAPSFSPEDVEDLTDDVPFRNRVREHAQEFGVVGHQEKVARAREGGDPLLLRRDFDTTDGGRAGVHFLSLQRSLADFRKTRKAMNGWYLRDDAESITDRSNNGLLRFITVRSRANFYVPPRPHRASPLLL